jgi:peptidoglycan/LPS O-acetylase OafA/YrhL
LGDAPRPTRSTSYRPDIDGLRAIAVLAVLAFHYEIAFRWSRAGYIGVDIFFVISGYLITQVLLLTTTKPRFLVSFYQRRVRRILPALVVVLAATALAGVLLLLPSELAALAKHTFGGSFFIANLLYWSEAGYFDAAAVTKPLLHLWSLGIEEQFYLCWPLLVWFVIWRRMSLGWAVAGIGLLSFAYSVAVSTGDPTAAFYSPLSRAWELAVGALIAIGPWRGTNLDTKLVRQLASWVGIVLLGVSFLILRSDQPWPGLPAALPVAATALLIFGGREQGMVSRTLSLKPLVWVGLISYPLYLWHWPLWSIYAVVAGHPDNPTKVVLLAATFVLAIATYFLVERPFRFDGQVGRKAVSLLAATGCVGLVGVGLWASDGAPQRPGLIATSAGAPEVDAQFAPWPYFQDATCMRRYPNPLAATYGWWFCVTSQDKPPTLLLFGDSQANQLYPGIVNNPAFSNQVVLSIGDCPVQTLGRVPSSNPCWGSKQTDQLDFIHSVIADNPSLRFAILAGLSGNPGPQQLQDLRSHLTFLLQHGVTPIVFYPQLQPTFDIHSCIARPILPAQSDCALPVSARPKLNEQFAPTVDLIRSEFPSVGLFDMNDLFCSSDTCSFLKGGVPLLRDQAHISAFASALLGQDFAIWATANEPELLR